MGKQVHSKSFSWNNEDEHARFYSIIAFAIIFSAIGIPLWWKTTKVYRADLPYGEIEALSDIKLAYQVSVIVILTDDSIEYDVFQKNKSSLNSSFTASSEKLVKEVYNWTVRYMYEEERQIFKSYKTPTDILEKIHDLKMYEDPGFLNFFVIPSSSCILSDTTTFYIGRHRNLLYKTGTDNALNMSKLLNLIQNRLVKKRELLKGILSKKSPEILPQDFASLRSVQFSPVYDVTFTLVIPHLNKVEAFWNIEESVQKYLKAMHQKLSFYANFNFKSQILLMTSLNVKTHLNSPKNYHYLEPDELSQIINPLETRLGSYVSTNPSLHFVVYIPSKDQSPLLIYDHNNKPSKSNSFLIPQWGGIIIYNIPNISNTSENSLYTNLDMNKVMGIFIGQLRLLLGFNFKIEDFQTKLSSYDESNVMDWELDSLIRMRAFENLLTATFTLNSLAQLLKEIKYIVISKQVKQYVSNAVECVKNGFVALKNGNLYESFRNSKNGLISAKKAFFDPSMLACLYFPDDQKYGIYLPLFLPVSIPIFSSLFMLWKIWKNRPKLENIN